MENMDLGKRSEFAASLNDVNIGSGFGDSQDHCPDHGKPSETKRRNEVHHNCVDLNIGDPPSSTGIKEEYDKDRMAVDVEPLRKMDNPYRSISQCSSSLSLKCSSNLLAPSTIQTRNSDLDSHTTKKLFGVEIGNLAKPSDIQANEMAEPTSGRSDVVSGPMFRDWVEPLDYGTVMIGKKWSNTKAIFPKGFRSRVTFYNIQDPTRDCCYISEVLDAGPLGPLFKVTMEQAPEVSFTDTSPIVCWDSVRARVNEEIKKQQSIDKPGVPDLLPPDSINGIEMFGFLSPQIIQEIEALDPRHQCLDYWLSKPSISAKEPPSDFAKSTFVEHTNSSHIRLLGVQITKKEPEQCGACP